VIEHVFVVMLENRSFDHLLGFSGLSGTDAITGRPTTVDGLTGDESNVLAAGVRVQVAPGADFILTSDPGHEFLDVVEQLCGRAAAYTSAEGNYPEINNSGFASSWAAKAPALDPGTIMRGFRPDQLPVLHTLAAEFAVCDRWFSSLPGPTWPNRLFVHAASSAGLDDSPTALRSIETLLAGYKFANGTIYDRLDNADLSWHVVEGDAMPQSLTLGGMIESAIEGRFISMAQLPTLIGDRGFQDRFVFIEPNYGHVLLDGSNFKCGNSQHPLDDITRGERFLKDVYELVRNSPHWDDSLLVITYDEHGGFFDHVAPPAAVPPNDGLGSSEYSRHNFDFKRLGVRVPAVVVSAYTPRATIDHSLHDHSSIPATLEKLFGLAPLTDRDREALGVESLCPLTTPRTDAPTTLPQPANSGIDECADGGEDRLAAALSVASDELSGDIDPALMGFLHVAVARDLHLAAAASRDVDRAIDSERDRLQETYAGIHTKFEAVRYIHDVEQRYRAFSGKL
jgi:phospholipase C